MIGDLDSSLSRREFLACVGLGIAAPAWAQASRSSSPIESITQQVLWSNADGRSETWFHPRACMVPREGAAPQALMTLQTIGGSDYFGPVHWSASDDLGRTWSQPRPIPALGRRPVSGHEGLEEGVCDVVPEFHPPTKSVLAMGHAVFYRGARFSRKDQLPRYPVYAVRNAAEEWSPAKKLEWDDPRGAFICTNGCGQRVTLPGGDILLAFTFCADPDAPRAVAGVRCAFDGSTLTVKEVGPAITHEAGRGLLEPSVTQLGDRYFLTIRAEDDRGYVSVSDDGLNWSPKKAWTWDDGMPLGMSTTQQHWLTHANALFLVYTRKDASNVNVIRWRSPLFVAQVDPHTLTLIRETERVVLPLVGDGVNAPDDVPLMGNFHVTNAGAREAWVTVGSWLPRRGARGETHLARIAWSGPR